jgi:hypothetical protein
MNIRSLLYRTARVMGDYRAVVHHHIRRRIERRVAGRMLGRLLGRLFR